MEIIKKIKKLNNILIISNQEVKEKLIDYFSNLPQLNNNIYKTYNEVIKDLVGKYDKLARIKLSKINQETSSSTQIYLQNSLLVTNDIKSSFRKINDLQKIKQDYSKYLIKNKLINNLYENKQILIINNFNTNDVFKIALSILEDINKNIEYLYSYEDLNQDFEVFEFTNYKEELIFIQKKIASLIENKVDPSKIKIHLPTLYLNYALEIFSYTNLPLNINSKNSIFSYEITKQIVRDLENYKDLNCEEAFKKVIRNFKSKDNLILEKVINVFNSYLKYDLKLSDIFDDLVYTLKNTDYSLKYIGGIKVCNILDEVILKDDYVFIAGFNQDEFPKVFKDEEYLLDFEREELGLDTSKEKNQIIVNQLIRVLKSIKNIFISYSITLPLSSIASKTRLAREVKLTKVENSYLNSYSKKLDQIQLGKYLDLFYKYDVSSPNLYSLFNMYPNNPYRKYNNLFTHTSKEVMAEFLKDGITLSYTAIDKFNKCGFLFYLENVLKIRRPSNEESLFIGNLIHHLLQALLTEELISDFDAFMKKEVLEFTKGALLNPKEEFFINQYIKTLSLLFKFIKEHENNSKFKIFGLEKEFILTLDFEIPVKLKGKIDKILTLELENTKYAIVIDYKSGSTDFDLNRIVHGLNMQIMFYFYFLNNYSLEKYKFAGGYLQGVMPNNTFANDPKKTYLVQMEDYFKLEGYSSSNIEVLRQIDRDILLESKFIKGIKFNKDGNFSSNSMKKVLSEARFNQLLKLTEEKIYDATKKILSGEFAINPKLIGKGFDSCAWCSYKDICFKNDENYEILEDYKGFIFLEENDDSK